VRRSRTTPSCRAEPRGSRCGSTAAPLSPKLRRTKSRHPPRTPVRGPHAAGEQR
jgi:hypothetical protein